MTDVFKRLKLAFFPPVGKKAAIEIVQKALTPEMPAFSVHRKRPANINVYNLPREPAWFISAPWGDGKDGTVLRSSRLILVSKTTGEILYDGPANDEG
jgi:hypothetical protein